MFEYTGVFWMLLVCFSDSICLDSLLDLHFLLLILGQVFSQKLLSLRDQHKTSEGSPSDDDSYLGYSVATGEFNGDNDNADVVVGMPRGANLTGKVNSLL